MDIHSAVTDGVCTITIARPERRNALDGAAWAAIAQTLRDLRSSPDRYLDRAAGQAGSPANSAESTQKCPPSPTPAGSAAVRAVVIESVGPTFCGGADLAWLRTAPEAELAIIGTALEEIRNCPWPAVARVQGPTYGGGIGLVAACDLVVAGPLAQFTLSEVRLGIVPALISPSLIARVGPARFRTWALLGRAISSGEAAAAGLIDVLATQTELDATVTAILTDLRRGEPEALEAIKRIPSDGLAAGPAARVLGALRDRPAFAEGLAALKEGRAPAWARGAPA